ncbi:MAG: hypothetical protein WC096_00460 [Sphaerochaetaceae bacterium]
MSDAHLYYIEIEYNTIWDHPGGDILWEDYFDCDVTAKTEDEAKDLGLARCEKERDLCDYESMCMLRDRYPDDHIDAFEEVVSCKATLYAEVEV